MNWLQKTAQQGFRTRSECTGHHNGQADCVIIAYMGDYEVGRLEYADFQEETFIQNIKVEPSFQRQGVATLLYKQLKAETTFPIRHTMQTPEGSAWRESLGDQA